LGFLPCCLVKSDDVILFLLWAAEYKGRKEAIEFCIFAAMNIEAYREYCLSLGNVVEKLPLVCGRKTRKSVMTF